MGTGRWRWTYLAPLILVALLIVAGCGGGGGTPTSQPAPTSRPTAAPAATVTPQPTPTPAPTATPTAAPTPKGPAGTLNIAVDVLGIENWVFRKTTGSESAVLRLFSEPLLEVDHRTRALQPGLATAWSVDARPSEVVWSFKLRPGVPFHEGQGEVTAEDVKATFAELLKPDSKPASTALIRLSIDNKLDNFEVVSPTEFKLHGKALDVTLPRSVSPVEPSYSGIMPKRYYDSVGDDGFNKRPIGTGPFVFRSHQPGLKVTLEAVPNHWRKTAAVKTVNVNLVPEAATRVAMLKTGQIDMAPLDKGFKPEVRGSGLKTFSIPKQALAFVALGGIFPDLPDKNCTTCPWVGIGGNAQKVREALTLAIDRQTIVDKLLLGEGEAAVAPFSWTPGPFAYNDPKWTAPFNPQRAKQLLAEAGFPNGFDIDFAIMTTSTFPENADTAEAVAGFWEAIGIKVKRQRVDFSPTWRQKMADRTTAGAAWVLANAFKDEPLRDMRGLFSKQAALAYLHDPKIDQFIVAAGQETNEERRMALSRELGSYFVEQRLGIPLVTNNGLWGANARISAWDNVAGFPFLNSVETVVQTGS